MMSLWASTTAPKVPLEFAGGDEAECVRARLRDRVSSPCGDDGEVELDNHPTGAGGCAALLIPSRCMESDQCLFHQEPNREPNCPSVKHSITLPLFTCASACPAARGALSAQRSPGKIRIVLLFITAVPNTKLCAWGEEDSGGHVL